jgi:hypothetical protein
MYFMLGLLSVLKIQAKAARTAISREGAVRAATIRARAAQNDQPFPLSKICLKKSSFRKVCGRRHLRPVGYFGPHPVRNPKP